MEVKKLIKFFWLRGSAYFTAICGSLMIALASVTNNNTQTTVEPWQFPGVGVEPSKFLLILSFCFVMSLGSTIRRMFPRAKIAGWVVHAICYVGGFLAFMLLGGISFPTAIVATAFFSAVYAVIAILTVFSERKKAAASLASKNKHQHSGKSKKSTSKNKKPEQSEQTYESMFS
ncbi:MAG: hypothetical protein E7649_00240 [Ruminococcaceae bacterium]|nr:hypothetical protein [Oscillospiraceae bacterium]